MCAERDPFLASKDVMGECSFWWKQRGSESEIEFLSSTRLFLITLTARVLQKAMNEPALSKCVDVESRSALYECQSKQQGKSHGEEQS